MTAINEFTKVRLKSGIIAVIMEIFDNGAAFLAEIETEKDFWDIITVERSDIVSVLKEQIVDLEEV